MLAEYGAFYSGSDCSSNDDPCQYCLIEISNHFLDRESDGGDRRIESCGDTSRRSYRQESFQVFTRESGRAAESAGHTRANLNRWPFTSKRGTRPDLQDADEKLSYCVAKRNATTFDRIGDFH